MTSRDTYADAMKLELDALNDQLRVFETKVTPARPDARDAYAVELVQLRRHAVVAWAQWQALQATSDASWQQVVSDMEHARDTYIHAFHVFRARL